MHPQIMISGRTAEDPPGTLEDEQNCTDGIGNGSQTSTSNRWGDYSSMSVDPVDQCTFYFTNEYYPTTAGASWHTRVCSFKFANCGQPDFALVPQSPPRIEMCGATTSTDPAYSIRAGVLNGFTGAVNLVANGVPAGATADFSVNPINAPGSSDADADRRRRAAVRRIRDDGRRHQRRIDAHARAVARRFGECAGRRDAADRRRTRRPTSRCVRRSSGATATSATRSSPTASTAPSPRPTGGTTDALSYTVEVATDSAFTNIVTSATVTTTQWTVDMTLDATTTYYWRVTPHNYCGDGAVSATFSFTTGVPGQCPSGTTVDDALFEDAFESGINGWTTSGTGATGFTQGPPPAGTGMSTTVWQVPDNDTTSDQMLDTPSIAIPGDGAGR